MSNSNDPFDIEFGEPDGPPPKTIAERVALGRATDSVADDGIVPFPQSRRKNRSRAD